MPKRLTSVRVPAPNHKVQVEPQAELTPTRLLPTVPRLAGRYFARPTATSIHAFSFGPIGRSDKDTVRMAAWLGERGGQLASWVKCFFEQSMPVALTGKPVPLGGLTHNWGA